MTSRMLAAVFFLCLLAAPALAGDLAAQLAAEASRQRAQLAALDLPEDEKQALASQLGRAEQSLAAGQRHLAFYHLQRSGANLDSYAYRQSNMEIANRGIEAFEAEWRRIGKERSLRQRRVAAGASPRQAAIIRAAVESSINPTGPLYQSGRLYGLNTTLDSGLFYLGRVLALYDFAEFSQKLEWPAEGRAPRLGPLDREIASLEANLSRAFSKPSGPNRAPLFIQANSTLKEAAEMNRARQHAGTLLYYLDAYRFYSIAETASEPPSPQALATAIDRARAALPAGFDHSIAHVFLEMAAAPLASGANAEPEVLRRAALIVDRVLPRYVELTTTKGVKP